MLYQHRQLNFLTIGLLFVGGLFNLVLFVAPESWLLKFAIFDELYQITTAPWKFYAIAISSFVVLLVINFSSLKIQFNRQSLRWSFGIGFPFKQIDIATISSVKLVRNKWWYGFGIRKLRHGWLYNVAGLDALELKLNNGKVIRLGSNDVKNLNKKLTKAMAVNQPSETK